MIIKSQRRKTRTKKVQKKFLRTEDDDEDFMPQLIGLGISVLGSQMAKPDEYNIDNPQMDQWQAYINDYMGPGGDVDAFRQMSQNYMDPNSEMNQSQRKTMQGNNLDQASLLSMLNRRQNPGTSSGILNAQSMMNTSNAMDSSNQMFQNQMMQNQNTGYQGMSQIPGMAMAGINAQGGVAENYSQAQIANTNNSNSYNAGMGSLLGQVGMGMWGGGV